MAAAAAAAAADVCRVRLYTFAERTAPDFRARLSTSANFRKALAYLPDSHVAYVMEHLGADAARAMTPADGMSLRAQLTANRWSNAVCHACLKSRGAVRPCGACFLYFYCSDACQAKDAANHTAYCCNRGAPLDSDDPLKPALVKVGGGTPTKSRRKQKAEAGARAQFDGIVNDLARKLAAGSSGGGSAVEAARELAAAMRALKVADDGVPVSPVPVPSTVLALGETDRAHFGFLDAMRTATPTANPFSFVSPLVAAFGLAAPPAVSVLQQWMKWRAAGAPLVRGE